jgi:hypothetical protein
VANEERQSESHFANYDVAAVNQQNDENNTALRKKQHFTRVN